MISLNSLVCFIPPEAERREFYRWDLTALCDPVHSVHLHHENALQQAADDC
jgi:hypothetical protein